MSGLPDIGHNIETTIAAIAALGTAAYGLVDASKAAWGGVSRVGFGRIRRTLTAFAPALEVSMGADWADVIFSHWLNGVSKDDQKAKAKSLIRLGLTAENAPKLAVAGHVDPDALTAAVKLILTGQDLTQADINILGRFDATVDAALDAAYERADQQYRNVARIASGSVAIGLALVAGYLIGGIDPFESVIVGLIAVPLAPIAKDLSSTLANAVGAMGAISGKKP